MGGTQLEAGAVFAGRYLIEARIARGGMGVVYRAYQQDMERRVALKVIQPDPADAVPKAEWFCREMRAAARIQHPNTVRVHDFGEADGLLYLAMELVEGRTLDQEIAACGRMGPRRAVHVGIQVAKALHAAHTEGVIHRDLKAENILLVDLYGERDVVKVVDFGIALVQEKGQRGQEGQPGPGGRAAADPGLAHGLVIGTPEFMSPEQAFHGAVDARSDLYALGVMLYHMVVGRPPFTGEDRAQVMRRHVSEPPVPPSQRVAGVPEPLEALILALLAKAPRDRPQTAASTVGLLAACATHEAVDRRGGERSGDGERSRTVPYQWATGGPLTPAAPARGAVAAPEPDPDAPTVVWPAPDPSEAGIDLASLRPRGRWWALAAIVAIVAGAVGFGWATRSVAPPARPPAYGVLVADLEAPPIAGPREPDAAQAPVVGPPSEAAAPAPTAPRPWVASREPEGESARPERLPELGGGAVIDLLGGWDEPPPKKKREAKRSPKRSRASKAKAEPWRAREVAAPPPAQVAPVGPREVAPAPDRPKVTRWQLRD